MVGVWDIRGSTNCFRSWMKCLCSMNLRLESKKVEIRVGKIGWTSGEYRARWEQRRPRSWRGQLWSSLSHPPQRGTRLIFLLFVFLMTRPEVVTSSIDFWVATTASSSERAKA